MFTNYVHCKAELSSEEICTCKSTHVDVQVSDNLIYKSIINLSLRMPQVAGSLIKIFFKICNL